MPGCRNNKSSTRLLAVAALVGVMGFAGPALAGLAFNFDASDLSTINGGTVLDGQAVTMWGQQFGNTTWADPLTPSSGTPIWNATGLNGLPSIFFDGADTTGAVLSSGSGVGAVGMGSFIDNDNWTVLVVAQTADSTKLSQTVFANPNGFDGGGGLSIRYRSDTEGWLYRFRDSSNGTQQLNLQFPAVDHDNNPATPALSGGLDEAALRGVSADGSNWLGLYNNEAPLVTVPDPGNTTLWDTGGPLNIGGRSNVTGALVSTWRFNGNVSQVVAFNQQLTGPDLANVQQAMSDKWGLGVAFGGDAAAGNLLLQQAPPPPPPPTLAQYEFEFGITSSIIQDLASRHTNPTNTASAFSAGGGNAVIGEGSMISSTQGKAPRSLFFGEQRWGKFQTDPPVEAVPGTATDNLQYLQFSVTPDAGLTMDISQLSMDWQRQTEAAIDSIVVYADLDASDGVSFSLADEVARVDSAPWLDGSFNPQLFDLSGVPALQGVGTEVTFRMYFWRQASAMGIFQFALDSDLSARLDNVILDGVVSSPALDGDLDGDGFVGIADLNIVLGNWNQNVPPGDPLADPSGDGFIGIADLNVVLGNWNAGTPPADGAVIPEPATLVMLGLGGLAVLRRRN
jgi:PEP-CTERM motif